MFLLFYDLTPNGNGIIQSFRFRSNDLEHLRLNSKNRQLTFVWLTSDLVCPQAFQIFKIFVLLSSDCSTRRHRSVMTYWFSAVGPQDVDDGAGSPFKPSFRSNASTNCAHVVSFVMPEIQRCSPCNQIGISSSESTDNDTSLISSDVCDGIENDAIDPSEELDEDVDKVPRIGFSVLWLRQWARRFVCSPLLLFVFWYEKDGRVTTITMRWYNSLIKYLCC